ncbi:endonuclease/exonuclease/phosphatase family metal-dependent hydrolase [Pelomyxa schiedti]|nr:endonuclease/exonuclease/phosphatase family metal-dependent hydrolase [Pelomyxa schiedti]
MKSGYGMDGVFDLSRTAEVINSISPDFVGLQEVDNKTTRAPVDEPYELGKATGMYPTYGKMRDYEGGGYGILILSKKNPIETRTFYYHNPDLVNQTRNCSGDPQDDDYCQGAIAVLLPYNDEQKVWFVTTHIGLYDMEENEVTELLSEFIPTLTGSDEIIVTGDFNTTPDTPPYNIMITGGFHDLWLTCGSGNGYTFDSDGPYERIDFIFSRSTYTTCTKMKVTTTQASDHLPVDAIMD